MVAMNCKLLRILFRIAQFIYCSSGPMNLPWFMCWAFIFKNILRAGISDRQDKRCLMAIHPQPQAMTVAAATTVVVMVAVTSNGGGNSSSRSSHSSSHSSSGRNYNW
jgi:uncharacterized membrane protein YgcG